MRTNNVDIAFYDMLKILYTRTFSLRKFSRKVFPFGLQVRLPELDACDTEKQNKNNLKAIEKTRQLPAT